jgi:hypothetical protein
LSFAPAPSSPARISRSSSRWTSEGSEFERRSAMLAAAAGAGAADAPFRGTRARVAAARGAVRRTGVFAMLRIGRAGV